MLGMVGVLLVVVVDQDLYLDQLCLRSFECLFQQRRLSEFK